MYWTQVANDGDNILIYLGLNINYKKERKKEVEGIKFSKVDLVVLIHRLKISTGEEGLDGRQ